MSDAVLTPDDVRETAAVCARALGEVEERDWSAPAGELEWSVQDTFDHVLNSLMRYSMQLANRADTRIPGPSGLASGYALGSLPALAAILAAVTEAAPPEARGHHFMGMADRTGFMAMGCDEMLIHTADILQGFGRAFDPPRELCRKVARRLFPWAPTDVDPWDALRWANGRSALPDRERLGPEWGWWCLPIEEWDGTPRYGS